MNKFIRIVAIVSAVLMGVSAILLIVVLCCQNSLSHLISTSDFSAFIVPGGPVIRILCSLGMAVLMCFFLGNKKVGIWFDILSFALIGFVFPFICSIVNYFETMMYTRVNGEMLMAARSAVMSLCNVPQFIAQAAVTILLLMCGMSIAYKRLTKE